MKDCHSLHAPGAKLSVRHWPVSPATALKPGADLQRRISPDSIT